MHSKDVYDYNSRFEMIAVCDQAALTGHAETVLETYLNESTAIVDVFNSPDVIKLIADRVAMLEDGHLERIVGMLDYRPEALL